VGKKKGIYSEHYKLLRWGISEGKKSSNFREGRKRGEKGRSAAKEEEANFKVERPTGSASRGRRGEEVTEGERLVRVRIHVKGDG